MGTYMVALMMWIKQLSSLAEEQKIRKGSAGSTIVDSTADEKR